MAILNAYPVATPGLFAGHSELGGPASHPYDQRKESFNFDILPNDKNHIAFRKSDLAYTEYQPFDQVHQ